MLDVSEQRVGDKAYFNRLYQNLDNGGASEFLYLLQNLRLGDWHPRQLIKTAEATEQQRMSADSVSEWAQVCIYADAINRGKGSYGIERTHDLETRISTECLYESYTVHCKQHGLRPVSVATFGKACAEMFGPRQRLRLEDMFKGRLETGYNGPRPWGYDVPDGETWQEKLDARLGIKK